MNPVNWSTLKEIRKSPKHYLYKLNHPREDTPALMRGRLVHCMVYEQDQTALRYVRQPRFHSSWGDEAAIKNGYDGGKQALAAWQAANAGREVIADDVWREALLIASAISLDSTAGPLVRGGFNEQQLHWTDAETGIPCRGRIDEIRGRIVELKTTAFIDRFGYEVARLAYHGQVAFYHDGALANGIELAELPPVFVAAEAEEPNDVVCYDVTQDVLAAGRALYRKCLRTLAECHERNEWPGIAGGTLVMPDWAMPEPELTLAGAEVF